MNRMQHAAAAAWLWIILAHCVQGTGAATVLCEPAFRQALRTGKRLRVQGQRRSGRWAGAVGDLYVRVQVKPGAQAGACLPGGRSRPRDSRNKADRLSRLSRFTEA